MTPDQLKGWKYAGKDDQGRDTYDKISPGDKSFPCSKERGPIEAGLASVRLSPSAQSGLAPGVSTIIRNSVASLNETEKRWLRHLTLRGYSQIHIQTISLWLAHKTSYRPDFWTVLNGVLTFYEVKSKYVREKGWIKLKLAARLFPECDFICAQWLGDIDGWKITKMPK